LCRLELLEFFALGVNDERADGVGPNTPYAPSSGATRRVGLKKPERLALKLS
jgi:hypothetical protein